MNSDFSNRAHLLYAILISFAVVMLYPFCENASAGTSDKTGTNADLYSLTITPASVPTGSHPQIVGFVSNLSTTSNGNDGKALFDVMAVILLPNGTQKSLLWRDVSFSAGQKKAYSCGTGFDTKQPGMYKITFSVYNSGKTHLYSSLSKSFTMHTPQTVSKPSPTAKPAVPPAAAAIKPKTPPSPAQKKDYPPARLDKPDTAVQQPPVQAEKPAETAAPLRRESPVERRILGIGGHVNTMNYSAGAAFTLWPLKNLALQGTYGTGTFTSYEARLFYRFPLSRLINPYLGAGYLHTERKGNVIGTDVAIAGSSGTVFAGLELQLYKFMYLYADASGTALKLKKEVVSGTTQATATVKYAPVTVNMGITFYLF